MSKELPSSSPEETIKTYVTSALKRAERLPSGKEVGQDMDNPAVVGDAELMRAFIEIYMEESDPDDLYFPEREGDDLEWYFVPVSSPVILPGVQPPVMTPSLGYDVKKFWTSPGSRENFVDAPILPVLQELVQRQESEFLSWRETHVVLPLAYFFEDEEFGNAYFMYPSLKGQNLNEYFDQFEKDQLQLPYSVAQKLSQQLAVSYSQGIGAAFDFMSEKGFVSQIMMFDKGEATLGQDGKFYLTDLNLYRKTEPGEKSMNQTITYFDTIISFLLSYFSRNVVEESASLGRAFLISQRKNDPERAWHEKLVGGNLDEYMEMVASIIGQQPTEILRSFYSEVTKHNLDFLRIIDDDSVELTMGLKLLALRTEHGERLFTLFKQSLEAALSQPLEWSFSSFAEELAEHLQT